MAWTIPQRRTSSYAAALFDLDGVLTPTADVHRAAWRTMFAAYFEANGVEPEYSDADYYSYVDGKPRYDGVAACLASRRIDLPWGEPTDGPDVETVCGLGNAKNAAFEEILAHDGVDPYPGSVALLDQLEQSGVAMAVVSSSRNAPAVLAAAAIADRFDVVVDGTVAVDEGIPGKPAPDMFEVAAKKLGVPSEEAVVIEDALSGVAAGAAGSFGLVVGVDRGVGAEALVEAGAELVVNDLEELIDR